MSSDSPRYFPKITDEALDSLRARTGVPSEMGEVFDEPAIMALPQSELTGVIRQPATTGPSV